MSRRFQFSLRTLLGLAAIICLMLGGWHLLETYGNYMDVGDMAVGKPITVKGRVIRVLGPPKCWIEASSSVADEQLEDGSSHAEWIRRSWLCCYEFEYELYPIKNPGEWTVTTIWMPRGQTGRFVRANRKCFTVSAK